MSDAKLDYRYEREFFNKTVDADEYLTLDDEIQTREFISILVVNALGTIVFLANAYSNRGVIDYENQNFNGLSIGWFTTIAILGAILTSYMVYRPYLISRDQGSSVVFFALIFYLIALVFWSIALFHSQINQGAAGIAAVLLMAATVWLGWVCYHLYRPSVYVFLLILLWTFYLQYYTYQVESHDWTGN